MSLVSEVTRSGRLSGTGLGASYLGSMERMWTLSKLAEETKLSWDFWDRQCKLNLIRYLQPGGPGNDRLIAQSALEEWQKAWAQGGQRAASPTPLAVATGIDRSAIDFNFKA